MINITNLDHLVLTVHSIEKTIDFYTHVLGMEAVTFAGGRKALAFGVQKINLHEYGNEFEPKASIPTPGSADLCFITNTALSQVIEHLRVHDVAVVEGPVIRSGAMGAIESVYLRDPDQNLIEISNYINK